MKETFFKHDDKDALRSCVKAINNCTTRSQGMLHGFAQNELKELEVELISKLDIALKEVADYDVESILVNMKRLYELPSTRAVPVETLYAGIIVVLKKFQNIDDEVVGFLLLNMYWDVYWCLNQIMHGNDVSEASLSSLTLKRNTMFDELEHFLQIPLEAQVKGISRSLGCRVREYTYALGCVWNCFFNLIFFIIVF
uniref:Cohesin subunit SCC3/SA HEAT-repeats domain-containing protein n=1 Tax=Helianthus annuus TaxID=4232 RepID=A0A251U741_HELAN